MTKLTIRTIEAVGPTQGRDIIVWDSALKGFGLRIKCSGARSFIAQYRNKYGRSRRVTIGGYGVLTPDQARKEARLILADVARGQDPASERQAARRVPTVSSLMDRYLVEHVEIHNKPSTRREVIRLVETRIKPRLGRHRVDGLTRAMIKAWHQEMRQTPYEANRALAYLSKALNLAAYEWELRPDNPCKGLKRFPESKRERYFGDAELRQIGEKLAERERAGTSPAGCITAVRLLAFTGMRLGEVLGLKWDYIDAKEGVIRLPDAKAGARVVPLAAPALVLLNALERKDGYVVHEGDPDKPLRVSILRRLWNEIRTAAGLPGARPHDFRHTAGTFAAQAGFNAFMVRDYLGHKTLAMTGRYVERAADPVRATADAVANRVAAAMTNRSAKIEDVCAA